MLNLVKLSFFETPCRFEITFWRVGCDRVEDVDEDKEEGDQESHSSLHTTK